MRKRKSWALPVFSVLSVACAMLCAPLARADAVTASVHLVGLNGCGVTTTVTDPVTASVGPLTCNGDALHMFTDSGSASGSWVTGTLAVSVSGSQVAGPTLEPTATVDLLSSGPVTLAPGMTSAQVTFGMNGITGAVSGSAPGTGGQASSVLDIFFTDLTSGASALTGACVEINTMNPSQCAPVPPALSPLTLTVSNGDIIQLKVHALSESILCCDGTFANTSFTVDPLFLDLPAGATYDSGIPGFLSGSPTTTPEPGSVLLLFSGLAALVSAARFGKGRSKNRELQS